MRTLLISIVLGLAVGCAPPSAPSQPAPSESAAGAATATSVSGVTLGWDANAGKALFAVCSSCHDPELLPALGPPMFGVQRRYKRATEGRDEFVKRMVAFVNAPSNEQAAMKDAVEKLGLMPALPLGEAPLHPLEAGHRVG